MKKYDNEKEIKKELKNRGYDGLFDIIQDFLNDSVSVGDKSPISVTVVVETPDCAFVSQKIDKRQSSKHSGKCVVEAVKRTESSESENDDDLDRVLNRADGMCQVACELGEWVKDNLDHRAKVEAKGVLTAVTNIIMKYMKESIPREKIKEVISDTLLDMMLKPTDEDD